MASISKIRKALKTRPEESPKLIPPADLLGSGATVLNLACTGQAIGAFAKGHYHFIVGDSESGKTWFTLTCFAEAMRRKSFKHYRLIHHNGERGALMDIEHFFGKAVADRIDVRYPETVEELYDDLDSLIREGKPFISVVDSMDVLDCAADMKKDAANKQARKRGTEEKGSFGVEKAKLNSKYLKKMTRRLSRTGSILIIISQTRDNLAFGFDKKTRAGGRALKFYADLEFWTSIKKVLKVRINGKDRQTGIIAQVQIKKNRFTGKRRTVDVPFYHDYGIDDIGGNIDYLLSENHWQGTEKKLRAPEFKFKGPRSKLIREIERTESERELREIVEKVWHGIEEKTRLKRKRRYA